ncbi:hypothetical protein CRG98_042991, partial [Punica granatum]
MSQYQEYHMENAADDHDMGEVDDEMYFHGRVMGDSDTDNDDEYAHLGCKRTKRDGNYYKFWRNTRSVKSTILHFQ